MKNYWFFITDEKNWKTIQKKNIYAVKEKFFNKFNQIDIGDLAVIYIKGKKIGGIFSIKDKNKVEGVLFGDRSYKYKINLKKEMVSKELLDVNYNLIKEVSIFKGVNRWGTVLMGRSIIKINKNDVISISKKLKLIQRS